LSLESRKSTALQDPGVEMLEQVTSLWARYGRIALGVLGAVLVIGLVTFYTLRQNAAQDNVASGRLLEADRLFLQGDLERCKTVAQEVARTYGSTRSGNDAHRLAGDAAYWLRQWKDAITEYQAYLSHNGSGLLADCVRRSLAYAYDSDGQYAQAVKLYDGLVGAFDRESSAELLTAAARCEVTLGSKPEAIKRLQRVVDEFGDTSFATPARVRLAELGAVPS